MRTRFRKVYAAKKDEKMASHKGDTTLRERLEQLKAAYREGLLTEAEFEAKKQQILADF